MMSTYDGKAEVSIKIRRPSIAAQPLHVQPIESFLPGAPSSITLILWMLNRGKEQHVL